MSNRFRSPLAAAMLTHRLHDLGIAQSWKIGSAGLRATPGQPALREVAAAAERFGLDLSAHRSARVDRDLLSEYDLILVMQAGQKEALLTEFPDLYDHVYLLSAVTERRSYDIPDALGSEPEMLEVVSELNSLIQRGLESMCVLATYLRNTKLNAQQLPG